MQKALFVACLLSAALLTSRCDLFGGSDDYFPGNVGSVWNYTWTQIVATPDSADTSTAAVKNELTAEVELANGDDAMMMVTTVDAHIDTAYFVKTDDGLWQYNSLDDTNPSQQVAFPFELNKTWTVNSYISAKVVAQENVTVPAGIYKKCWKVEYTNITDADTSVFHQWFAAGTGNVKYRQHAEMSGFTMTMTSELSSATIK